MWGRARKCFSTETMVFPLYANCCAQKPHTTTPPSSQMGFCMRPGVPRWRFHPFAFLCVNILRTVSPDRKLVEPETRAHSAAHSPKDVVAAGCDDAVHQLY